MLFGAGNGWGQLGAGLKEGAGFREEVGSKMESFGGGGPTMGGAWV